MNRDPIERLPFGYEDVRRAVAYGPYLLSVAVVLVVLLELVWPRTFNVSWQVVALLALLAILINHEELERFDLPVVGNGLGPDVRSAHAELRDALDSMDRRNRALSENEVVYPSSAGRPPEDEFEGLTDRLYDLLGEDPGLAVAKLRDELRFASRDLASRRGVAFETIESRREDSVPETDVFDTTIAENYARVLEFCDRAIRGDDARLEDGIELVALGTDLLRSMRYVGYDAKLRPGSTCWIGMNILVADGAVEPNRTYQLRRADGSPDELESGDIVAEFLADEHGEFVVETDDVPPGEYVLVGDGDPLEFDLTGRTARDAGIARFELRDQTFSASFESGWAFDQGERTGDALVLESNRSPYVVWATVRGIEEADLEAIFAECEQFLGTFSRGDTASAILKGGRDSSIAADFTDVEPAEYDFELSVPDTGEWDEAPLSVQTF